MTVALINPNLIVQRNDPFTTGIVYMPIGLAYLAAALRQQGHDVRVVDAFGDAPRQTRLMDRLMVLGLEPEQVADQLPEDISVVFVFCNQVANHISVAAIVRAVKLRLPNTRVVLVENTQAVDRKSTRLNSNHVSESRMPSSA